MPLPTKTLLRLFAFLGLLSLAACRGEEDIIPSTTTQVASQEDLREVGGFYLLNEGNMGRNKASLDFYDYSTGAYHRNIYPERNPSVVKELGDVGNDLQLYGSRLWAVINNSKLVEVMDASTAKHIGSVPIPNGRYVAFAGRYAYVSSYAGEVKIDPNARLGYVAKIDTATLQIVGRCTVGYQPEQLVIQGDKLYVANSGGYRAPNYDNTISIIDLNTFTEQAKIPVAINLHSLIADDQGRLWVTSRGDYKSVPSSLHVVDPRLGRVVKSFDLGASGIAYHQGKIYVYAQPYVGDQKGKPSYSLIDTRTLEVLPEPFLSAEEAAKIATPYGIAINPETGQVLISDAGNYVTPGRLRAYTPSGTLAWTAITGEIPGHIAFLPKRLTQGYTPPVVDPTKPKVSPYITRVLAYRPGVGQFVNELPAYEEGDTEATMIAKAQALLKENKQGLVTLGAWGGYITLGFDHTIENKPGLRDFLVLGNNPAAGWGEPGIIYVAHDKNKNGKPDPDEWYEIAGEAHNALASIPWLRAQRERGKDVAFWRDYEVTYYRPTSEGKPKTDMPGYITWRDNKGKTGSFHKNRFHDQSYYPAWITSDYYTLRGTRLPQNGYNSGDEVHEHHILQALAYGYADNALNDEDDAAIDIDWAIDRAGKSVHLPGVDFVRIQTGVLQDNGWLGECSTEVTGVSDLHLLGRKIPTRNFKSFKRSYR